MADSMSYKFKSNSKKITINYEVSGIVKGYFPQIGLSAREGICILYRSTNDSQWYNIECSYNTSSKFDAKTYHVTYHDVNYLQQVYEYFSNNQVPIADIGIIEIDYFSQKESVVEEILPKVIQLMQEKCKYIICWHTIPPIKSYKKMIDKNILKKYLNNNIKLIDLSYLYNPEYRHMCTFNNYYINDTGNIMIYKEIEKQIRGLTKWNI